MSRRSSRQHSYWMLVADHTGSALQRYHLVQLDGSSITENALESSFPHCILQRMPVYMNNASAAIKSKGIYCSFCRDNLLDWIGRMATKYSYSQLMQLYDFEESFVTEFIELVYCRYIFKALQILENDRSRPMSRDHYYLILKRCKNDTKMK
jgi:hypothetical protein